MKRLFKNLTILGVVLTLGAGGSSVFSKTQDVKVAHSGYDVVSYFADGKAKQGSSEFTTIYKDSVYQFSSGEHQAMFLKDPVKYLPQFDGFCAYGVTFAQKIEADPKVWEIVNGKLYFNLNEKFLKDWSKDVLASIKKGNEEWELIKDVLPEDL